MINKPHRLNQHTKHAHPKRERIICSIGYIIIPLFFLTLYLIMYMSYEDIYQSYAGSSSSTLDIINVTYHALPRIGELYQRVAVHFMDISTSFGLNLCFRIITAILAILLVYLASFFVLKKRPRLQYKDLAIFLGFFLICMISEVSEVFTFRFSYANNYIIAAVLTIGFLLPFRLHSKTKSIWQIIGMVILGVLFGMSTEIGPLAILIIFSVWACIKLAKKQLHIKKILQSYKMQIFGIIGMLIGIALVFSTGSLFNRAGGSYGEYYDYVSLFDVFKKDSALVLYKLWQHAWFNMRYLMFTPLIIGIFITAEALISKYIKHAKSNHPLYLCILAFCAIYMGASCQLKVLDDLYPRYFFLIYVAIFVAILTFINFLISTFPPREKSLRITSNLLLILSGVAFLDMVFAFTVYRTQINNQLYKIQLNPNHTNTEEIVQITEDYSHTTMIPSPVFKFAQLSPFDWGDFGDNYLKYGYGPQKKLPKN